MTERDTHDYVIVGAGTAGCVLAHRLSRDEDTGVLLLEAGEPDDKEEIHIPAMFPHLFKSEVDWDYSTAPQPGLNGRAEYYPRGKTLGGSSAINAMMYVRGNPWDYDRWERLGNEGWSYDDLLPYFCRAEDFEGGASEFHGADGPLRITRQDDFTEQSRALVEAAEEVGFEYNDDFNAGRQTGVGPFHLTADGDQRESTAVAYLRPVLDRENLTAETGAHVTRVLFDGDRAVGVEYEQEGRRHTVEAEREVILSAGAVDSPKLLLLSGIGPADHLDDHGIEPRIDAPGVGRNLQDHLLTHAVYECTEDFELPPSSNLGENGAFERTDPGLPAPDLQYFLAPVYFMNHGFDNPEGKGFSIGATFLRPKSRGRITLRSADPFDDPVIDPQYFDEREDLDRLVEGIKRAREIGRADALDEYRGEELWPGEAVQSDEGIAEHVRETVQTVYHPVGTCKMGDDAMAVVDDRLRVHGVDGLRVVDASIMPRITSGNTNAPVIAIAEKAADLIREDA
ncbi:MAG: GMC family oxidoreductase [Haloquadratum sp.]